MATFYIIVWGEMLFSVYADKNIALMKCAELNQGSAKGKAYVVEAIEQRKIRPNVTLTEEEVK